MNLEIEATFTNINKDELREKLKAIGAKQIYPEFLQKRVAFNLPDLDSKIKVWGKDIEINLKESSIEFDGKSMQVSDTVALKEIIAIINSKEIRSATNKGWLRVRQESDKITMTYKRQDSSFIDGMKEIELEVYDFEVAYQLLEFLGCEYKAYQETKRELWEFKGAQIMIDKWPHIEDFAEIEAGSQELVEEVAKDLGFDWRDAYFGAVDGLYARKYGISKDQINNFTPRIMFNEPNPFLIKLEDKPNFK